MVLVVEVQGVGLVGAPERPGASLGLVGMRERASLLGGVLKIDSRPGEGTRLECRAPLRRRASPAAAGED